MLPINTFVTKVAASPIAAMAGARLLYNATATAGIAMYSFGNGGGKTTTTIRRKNSFLDSIMYPKQND